MKHYFIALALTLCCFGAAQAQKLPAGMNPAQARQMAKNASGQQLAGYVQQAKAAGYSLNDVKSLLRAQGASMADIKQLEELWNAPEGTLQQGAAATKTIQSNFGINPFLAGQQPAPEEEKDDLFSIKRFGSDYFKAQQQQTTETAPSALHCHPIRLPAGPRR